MSAVPVPPRVYVRSWAASGGRRFAARVVDSAPACVLVVLGIALGPPGRPFAQDLLILALVATWETVSLARWGATVGQRALDLRVVAFDRAAPGMPWLQALRRSFPIALCYLLPFPGTLLVLTMPLALLISMATSPHRQAFHDRISDTFVVDRSMPLPLARADVELWYEPAAAAQMTPWGRAPDLHERRRARAHRLDGLWGLAAVAVGGYLIATVISRSAWPLLWLAVFWMVVISIDEAKRLSRDGRTPGHAFAGFVVVDIVTGQPPSRARALARSVVLAPLLYLPPLQLLLGLWVHASSQHRGPHDLVGHTVVVEPGYVPPHFAVPAAPLWAPMPPVWAAGAPAGYPPPPWIAVPRPAAPPPPPFRPVPTAPPPPPTTESPRPFNGPGAF